LFRFCCWNSVKNSAAFLFNWCCCSVPVLDLTCNLSDFSCFSINFPASKNYFENLNIFLKMLLFCILIFFWLNDVLYVYFIFILFSGCALFLWQTNFCFQLSQENWFFFLFLKLVTFWKIFRLFQNWIFKYNMKFSIFKVLLKNLLKNDNNKNIIINSFIFNLI
jgi:hypothetical protein